MSLREKDMDFFAYLVFGNSAGGRSKEELYISNIIDL